MDRVRKEICCDDYIMSKYTGKNVGVAILDTGVYLHNDLRNKVISFVDFINGKNKIYDDNGHGTHIAGIIAGSGISSDGRYRGIAPDVNLICIKVLDHLGDGSTNNVLKGIDFIIKNKENLGIKIVNISIGSIPKSNSSEHTRLIKGVEAAWDAGLCVIVAAGNNGPEPMSITTPGISRKVITVGNSDISEKGLTDNRKIKNYSGRGPTPFCIMKPEVIAPGLQIKSCKNDNNSYVYKTGSSMATAVVSASIALLIEKYPYITNFDIKLKLYKKCKDINLPKNQQGWGMINLYNLL